MIIYNNGMQLEPQIDQQLEQPVPHFFRRIPGVPQKRFPFVSDRHDLRLILGDERFPDFGSCWLVKLKSPVDSDKSGCHLAISPSAK